MAIPGNFNPSKLMEWKVSPDLKCLSSALSSPDVQCYILSHTTVAYSYKYKYNLSLSMDLVSKFASFQLRRVL